MKEENGRKFAYQFTFFKVGILPTTPKLASDWATSTLIMGHAAISDLDTEKHYFSEVLYRVVPMLGGFGADSLIAWSRGPTGTKDKWTLSWNGEAFDFVMGDLWQKIGFVLSTRPTKPLIFQGPNGYSRKGPGESAASQYYSFTRLATSGAISIGSDTFEVTGESWMDKEFGSNQLGQYQIGWDWFSLQLDDQREVMLYMLRDQDGQTNHASGTVVKKDGTTQYLNKDAFSVTATDQWTSDNTSATYPSKWTLEVNGEQWVVEPEMADQENRARKVPRLFYWEGAVKISDKNGKPIGKGYVELTGYGNGTKPGI